MATTTRKSHRACGAGAPTRHCRSPNRRLPSCPGTCRRPPTRKRRIRTRCPPAARSSTAPARFTLRRARNLQIDQYTQKMHRRSSARSRSARTRQREPVQPGASSIALFRPTWSRRPVARSSATSPPTASVFLVQPERRALRRQRARRCSARSSQPRSSITDHDFMAGRYQLVQRRQRGERRQPGPRSSPPTATPRSSARRCATTASSSPAPEALPLPRAIASALDMIGDGLISLSVDQAALQRLSRSTPAASTADGGTVLLTARSANALLDTVINNSGTIRANSLVERNGEIVLDGGSAGVVSVDRHRCRRQVFEAGTTGGTIKVLGDKVGFFGSGCRSMHRAMLAAARCSSAVTSREGAREQRID